MKEGCNIAIRVTHGKASTIAQFGIEAGKGEQRVRQEAEAQATARQQAQIDAQAAANALRASTDIQKTILNAQARQEAEAFQSFMQGESAKRTIAWEQEKIELRRQHDFDMGEQRRDIENQLKMTDDQREKTKLQSAFTAIDNAVERGDISSKEGNELKLKKELGATGSSLFPKRDEKDVFSRFVGELSKEEKVVSSVQQDIASLNSLIPGLSIEDKKFAKEVAERADPVEVRATIDTLEVKVQEDKTAKSIAKDRSFLESRIAGLDADKKIIVQRALDSDNPLQIEETAESIRELERREKRRIGLSAVAKRKIREKKESRERREIQESLGVRNIRDFQKTSTALRLGGL